MKIEGKNSIIEALKSGKTIDKVLVQNGLRDESSRNLVRALKEANAKVQFCDKAVLDKECGTGKSQGFIAFISDYRYYEIDEILDNGGKPHLIIVLDGVEDPHNLGSVLRVAECVGADGVIIGKHRSASVNDTVMSVSAGSANYVKVARVTNINSVLDELKKNGVWVYGVELGGENIYKSDLTGNVALVIGGEGTGLNRLTKEHCDKVLTIPMQGKINSLNASVATGVAVFEAFRQRM